jgi:plastocyanin
VIKSFRLAVVLLAIAAVAACGGGSTSSSGAPAGSTQVNVMDFSFKPKDMTVSSGKVVFFLINSGPSAHDMLIVDSTGRTLDRSSLVQPGDTFTFTIANLAAGKYVFYCDVIGHRAAGMEGALTVT